MTLVRPSPAALDAIARAFLPSRWHYHYVRGKLTSDPLYAGVAGALAGQGSGVMPQPVLDLGCGVGLLAHYLAACDLDIAYHGVDNDAGKIAQAQAAAATAGLHRVRFAVVDLSRACPSHHGNVTILDLLQFLPPEAQAPLLRRAAACVAPGGCLIIRTGLAGTGWRARVTRAVDVLSRVLRWMNTGPKDYPHRAALDALLREAGLTPSFSPLWGGTPFNNWLVVAERPSVPTSASGSVGSTQR